MSCRYSCCHGCGQSGGESVMQLCIAWSASSVGESGSEPVAGSGSVTSNTSIIANGTVCVAHGVLMIVAISRDLSASAKVNKRYTFLGRFGIRLTLVPLSLSDIRARPLRSVLSHQRTVFITNPFRNTDSFLTGVLLSSISPYGNLTHGFS